MKQQDIRCMDCGSAAIDRIVDEVKPIFRMEVVHFACGAVMKSTYTRNGNIGRISHADCAGFPDITQLI